MDCWDEVGFEPYGIGLVTWGVSLGAMPQVMVCKPDGLFWHIYIYVMRLKASHNTAWGIAPREIPQEHRTQERHPKNITPRTSPQESPRTQNSISFKQNNLNNTRMCPTILQHHKLINKDAVISL